MLLLGITQASQLATHPFRVRGAIFETYIVSELRKQTRNQSKRPRLHFFRSRDGHEVDVLIDKGQTLKPVEIKSASPVRQNLGDELKYYRLLNPQADEGVLIYCGVDNPQYLNMKILNFRSISRLKADFI